MKLIYIGTYSHKLGRHIPITKKAKDKYLYDKESTKFRDIIYLTIILPPYRLLSIIHS